jgi:hypothetical protein
MLRIIYFCAENFISHSAAEGDMRKSRINTAYLRTRSR